MSRHTYNRAFVLAIVLFACLFVPSTYAQIAGATLSGTVADPTGSVIPNAQLSIRNTATGVATAVSVAERRLNVPTVGCLGCSGTSR